MGTKIKAEELTWIRQAEAVRVTGFRHSTLDRAGLLGRVRVRLLPGLAPEFCKEDCLRFKASRDMPAPRKADAAKKVKIG